MQRKSFTICGLTCIAGIFGAFARWLQNTNAFEETTGLAIPGSLWSIVLPVYIAVCAVAFFFAVRYLVDRKKLTTGIEYPAAFSGGPAIRTVVAVASLILLGIGGAVTALSELGATRSVFDIISGATVAIAAFCVFYILRNISSGEKKGGGAALIAVVLTLCYRLVAEYKLSAPDPVVWHFAIRVLAVSGTILAYYYLCGYCYERPKPKRTIYFCMLGIFLSIMTFSDSASIAYHMITLGLVLSLLTLMFLLIGNMTPVASEGGDAEHEIESASEPQSDLK